MTTSTKPRGADAITLPATDRQLQLLQAIADAGRLPPTLRELAAALGLASHYRVTELISAVERRGLVEREGSKARGLFLTEAGRAALKGGQ